MQENITVGRHALRVRGLGDFSACKTALAPVLLNSTLATATPLPDSSCSGTSCKISEFQRPSQKYDSLEFYGTSEFWYTMRDVLRIGGKYSAAVFESAAKVRPVDHFGQDIEYKTNSKYGSDISNRVSEVWDP